MISKEYYFYLGTYLPTALLPSTSFQINDRVRAIFIKQTIAILPIDIELFDWINQFAPLQFQRNSLFNYLFSGIANALWSVYFARITKLAMYA